MLTVAIFNFKGGTGKTTTALNLGACLATQKRRVVVIDLDGQRTLSYGLGGDGNAPTALDWLQNRVVQPMATEVKNLCLIPGHLGLFQLQADRDLFTPALGRLEQFEICLLDCPPGLGVVASQAILSCDRLLIPAISEPAVLKGLSEAVQLVREERPDVPIEVLRCRYRSRLAISRQADVILTAGQEELNYRLLDTMIPENVAIAEAIAPQQPVINYAPKSTGAKAYKQLAQECLKNWYE